MSGLDEVAYHKTVNEALRNTLIPNAQNPELKALLQAFAWAHVKLAGIALWPIGKMIVPA
jgi:predicted outer membrane protein